MRQTIHYTAPFLNAGTDPIRINLIGVGGTGSLVLTHLARQHHTLTELGRPGLYVTVWDNDTVSRANMGRQLFAEAELGMNKGHALIARINRFFGTNWKATGQHFNRQSGNLTSANIFISCVDTVAARQEIAGIIRLAEKEKRNHRDKPFYWMDYGNGPSSGQVILSTVSPVEQPARTDFETVAGLPFITDEFSALLDSSEGKATGPSCSLAEALTRQDLFINTNLAAVGAHLLWNLFRKGYTHHRGVLVNLDTMVNRPIPV